MAEKRPTTNENRRRRKDRRAAEEDRRAFWRPTPDRRREHAELGRRRDDPVKASPR
jgi:hypothetical protein